jgi:hypothetical protein
MPIRSQEEDPLITNTSIAEVLAPPAQEEMEEELPYPAHFGM